MVNDFFKTRPVYVLIDIILIGISLISVYFIKYTYLIADNWVIDFFYLQEYYFIFFLWMLFIIISLSLKNLYSTDRGLTIVQETSKTIEALIYATVLTGAIIFFTKYKFFSRQVFLTGFLVLAFLLVGFRISKRLIIRKLIARGYHTINVLIVGADKFSWTIIDEIKRVPWLGFKVVGFLDDAAQGEIKGIPVLGRIDDFANIAKRFFVDEVIVAISIYEKAIPELISQAKRMKLGIRLFPQNPQDNLPALNINYLGFVPLINYGEKNYYISGFVFKRILDFLAALFILIFLSPLFIVIAILIKLDSAGPVFYVRQRMGMKGRFFDFYKFRSMVSEADNLKKGLLGKNEVKDGVIFKIRKDPRVTKIGSFLRKYSLDELPQLFNVLKGDMSLVGPRPFPIEESKRIKHYHLPRLNIRPGMTGLSQVRGRSELSFRNWMRWDLWYVNNWSFGLDLQIILWTIPVVIRGKGAY
ncbi:MAG: sugar transferase [Candidatus Omnitrophica bacterium]|nr:sugar transferase [Candidatus Omnitrophota bacterium]